jgi:transposase
MGYTYLRPRSMPEKQDEMARAAFREQVAELVADPTVELWYQDESGFQGDPRPRQLLARTGSRPTLSYTGAHRCESVLGAVRPADGRFVSLIMPRANTEIFQIFLDHLQPFLGSRRVVMVLDNASWHKTHALRWGRIEPRYLPPYSPDFNPIERLWLNLKTNYFSTFVARSQEELTDHLALALRYYMEHHDVCQSICGS